MPDARCRRVAAVRDHMVARGDREVPERLAGARTLGFRNGEVIADQRGKAHAVVDPPKRAGPAGLLHGRRVERADLQPGFPVFNRRAELAEKRLAKRMKPGAGLGKALLQRNRGKVGEPGPVGPDRSLAQRMPAAEMKKQGAKQILRRLVLAQPLEGAGLGSQFLPTGRKEAHKQFPILVHAAPLPEIADAAPHHNSCPPQTR